MVQTVEDVSIVLPVFNDEATLVEALESALMQVGPTSVIYCLNDASTDGSSRILEEYAARYPSRFQLYHNTVNQGSTKKSIYWNRPEIPGRYFCFLGSDDYWITPDKLAKQVAFLDANPSYIGCSCDTLVRNEETGETSFIKSDRRDWSIMDLLRWRRRYGLYVHTSSIVWRNLYLEDGFFLPAAFEGGYGHGDVVLMHMMMARGGLMHNIPEVMSCYRYTGRGVWSQKSVKEQKRIQRVVRRNVFMSVPLKYKLANAVHMLFLYAKPVRTLIPGPLND